MPTTDDFSKLERRLHRAVNQEQAALDTTDALIEEAVSAGMPLTAIAPEVGLTLMQLRWRRGKRTPTSITSAEKTNTAAKLKYEAIYDAQPTFMYPANSLIRQSEAADLLDRPRGDVNSWVAAGRIEVETMDGVPMVKLDDTGRFRIAPPRTRIG